MDINFENPDEVVVAMRAAVGLFKKRLVKVLDVSDPEEI
jgi:hypothetical protein